MKYKISRKLLFRISLAALIFGELMKIMHWPGAGWVTSFAFAGIGVFTFLWFQNKAEKSLFTWSTLLLVTTWAIRGIFKSHHLPGANVFDIMILVLIGIWLLAGGIAYLTGLRKEELYRTKSRRDIALSVVSYMAIALFVIGAIFKMMHWPYGLHLLILGGVFGIVWLLAETFAKENQ